MAFSNRILWTLDGSDGHPESWACTVYLTALLRKVLGPNVCIYIYIYILRPNSVCMLWLISTWSLPLPRIGIAVLPRAISKTLISWSLCIQTDFVQVQDITSFIKSILTLCTNLCFCFQVRRQKNKNWEREREKKISAADFSRCHGNRVFKGFLMRTVGRKRLITRVTICYSNWKSNSLIAHTYTHTAYSSGSLCKNSVIFPTLL